MMIFNGEGGGGGYGGGQWDGGFGGCALNKDAKTEALKMIGQGSNLCQRHIPRTSFNSKTDCIPYLIKLCFKSNGNFRQ